VRWSVLGGIIEHGIASITTMESGPMNPAVEFRTNFPVDGGLAAFLSSLCSLRSCAILAVNES
jgi:hypothetical protein